MNCKRVKEELLFLFDDEMGQEVLIAFRRHVDHCPHCAECVESSRLVLTVLRQRVARVARMPAPRGLRTKILAGLQDRRR